MIRRAFTLLLLAPAAIAAGQTAPPPAPVPTHRVVYVEVAPAEAQRAITALKAYRQAVRQAPGMARVEVLQQIGRANFFAVEEKWNDGPSLQAHLASALVKRLRDDLQPALITPLDDRPLAAITAQAASGSASAQAIHVLTHADAGSRREEIPGMLRELATGARRERGNVLFDATFQPARTNHFTIIEVWADQKAYDAHVTAENTKKFRAEFAPVSGALYDERLYKVIN